MIKLYGIPNCDTVKRARAWMNEASVTYEFVDFKKSGVPMQELKLWLECLGWDKVLNRNGTTWRKLDDSTRARVVDAASAAELMQAQPSVIKRPVVQWRDGVCTVGFSAELFRERLTG